MGIRELNKILASAGVRSLEIDELTRFAPQSLNVALDGLQFIHAGARGNLCDERRIAESAFDCIDELLCRLEQICSVGSVWFYVDGIAPRAKHHPPPEPKQFRFSLAEATRYLYELLKRSRLSKICVVDLKTGEAEHAMFAQRDTTHPNLLVTNDTDAFHIAYRYRKQSSADIVLLTDTSLNKLYNMATLTLNVPKLVFAVIAFARGSDFTEPIFNSSICIALLQMFDAFARQSTTTPYYSPYWRDLAAICEKYERAESEFQFEVTQQQQQSSARAPRQLYETDDVERILSTLLLMLIDDRRPQSITFTWSKFARADGEQTVSTPSYLSALAWGVNYSLLGSDIDHYECGPEVGKVDVYCVYLDVLAVNPHWQMQANESDATESRTTFKRLTQRWLKQQR